MAQMPPSNVAIDLKGFPPLPSAGAKPTRMTASKHVPASDQTDSDTKTASANTTTAEHADTKTEALLKPRIFNGAPLEKILKVVARYQHRLRAEPEHPHRLAMLKAIEQGFGIAMMAVRVNGLQQTDAAHVAALIESDHVLAASFGANGTSRRASARPERALRSFKGRASRKLRRVYGASLPYGAICNGLVKLEGTFRQKLGETLPASGEAPQSKLDKELRAVLPAIDCAVPNEAVAMPSLVSPEGILYVINDTGVNQPGLAELRRRRPDLPPFKNLHQLFGWTEAPRGRHRGKAGDWQLLEDVKWAENASCDLIPLIGSRDNALKNFNRYNSTSYILDDRFNKLMSGKRVFEGWRQLVDVGVPHEAAALSDGSSLFGLRVQPPAQDAVMHEVRLSCDDVVR